MNALQFMHMKVLEPKLMHQQNCLSEKCFPKISMRHPKPSRAKRSLWRQRDKPVVG
jgi:hypothetical protein